jgi:5-methylcytosine-specific restriction endonuclease McrA
MARKKKKYKPGDYGARTCQVYREKMAALPAKRAAIKAARLAHRQRKRMARQDRVGKPRPPQRPPMLRKRPDYYEYLRSETWRKVRLWRIYLAGNKCQKCGAGAPFQVHHLNYDRLGRELCTDLQVLCFPCHKKVHETDLESVEHLRSIQRQTLSH